MSHPYDLNRVSTATVENEAELAGTIALAFGSLPASLHLIDEEVERHQVLVRTFQNDLEDVRKSGNGMIRTFPGLEACAVWMYHSGRSEPVPQLDARLEQAAGPWAPRFLEFYTALDDHRREVMRKRSHWHLWVLAVHPDKQGQGFSRLLLVDRIVAFDVLGVPIYLEAATEALADTYGRYGFKDVGEPIVLGDGKTRMFPMLREPDPSYL